MQFKNIQINGFGNLKDVNLNFKNGLNIVTGDNESGKSTLSEFIKGIFYGINKNKNGKDFSDLEKFKPWDESNFSGKLLYTLNDDEYVVFRDFNKNNAKVYDKSGQEVTDMFNKDKSRGAEVGIQHLEMDEDTFENSVFVKQKKIKINELSQSTILQKLTNIIKSGEEDVSYENTLKKLEKILLDEVGTDRTQNKPKNILKKAIADLQISKSRLIINREKHDEIDEKLKALKEDINKNQEKLDSAINTFNIKNKYEKMIQDQKAQFDIEQKLKNEQKEIAKAKNKKRKIIDTIIISILNFVLSTVFVVINQLWIALAVLLVISVITILNAKLRYKEELDIKTNNFDLVSEEVRKKENKELESLEKDGVKKTYTESKITDLKKIIEEAEKEKNDLALAEHKLIIEDESLDEGLSNLNDVEEELALKEEETKKLMQKEEALKYAIEKLQESYAELKEEVIPDIEKDIKAYISRTTNGKYLNVRYNDYDGLITENELGQIVTVDKLSIGTLDQMYLGFRMAIASKYNNVPIIFDESFVYCDDNRLKNILKVLADMSAERQIIILTCSNREKNILQELNIEANTIDLNDR